MPGLLDSRGEIIDVLNCFMNKHVFTIAKSVKFIIPIVVEQLKGARGIEVVRQINLILKMCGDNRSNLIDSM